MADLNYTKGEWKTYKWEEGFRLESNTGENIAYSIIGEANAHLISAAPEMYEALTEIYSTCRQFLLLPQNNSTMIKSGKALAKAEGKEEK